MLLLNVDVYTHTHTRTSALHEDECINQNLPQIHPTHVRLMFVYGCERDSHMPNKYLMQQEVEDASIFHISRTQKTHTNTHTQMSSLYISLSNPSLLPSALVFLSS